MPLASKRRASSRFARAALSETSGYTPSERRFSFSANRYLRRHHLPPLGEISRYRPPPSKRRAGFAPALALRMAISVNGILGATLGSVAPIVEIMLLMDIQGLQWTSLD